jgi:hypothetical protein
MLLSLSLSTDSPRVIHISVFLGATTYMANIENKVIWFKNTNKDNTIVLKTLHENTKS